MRRAIAWAALALGSALGIAVSARTSLLIATTYRAAIDYRVYAAGARIGLEHGWSRLYDLRLQADAIAVMFPPGLTWTPFASPPPVAWLVAPFAAVPSGLGRETWQAAIGAALLLSGAIAAGDGGRRRAMGILSVVALPSAAWDVGVGNVVGLMALAVAAAGVALTAGADGLAGLALVTLTLKPQLAWLVPVALAASGRWRALAVFGICSLVVAGASVLALGRGGVIAYVDVLHAVGGLTDQRRFSLEHALPGLLPTAIRLGVLVLVVLAGIRRGRSEPRMALLAGITGSLAFTPYLNLPDLVLCLPATWWLAGRAPSAAALYWVAALMGPFWELPWLLAQLAVLLWLGAAPIRRPGRKQSREWSLGPMDAAS